MKQDREQDTVTEDIRDVGELVRQDRDDSRTEDRTVEVEPTQWENTTVTNITTLAPAADTQT